MAVVKAPCVWAWPLKFAGHKAHGAAVFVSAAIPGVPHHGMTDGGKVPPNLVASSGFNLNQKVRGAGFRMIRDHAVTGEGFLAVERYRDGVDFLVRNPQNLDTVSFDDLTILKKLREPACGLPRMSHQNQTRGFPVQPVHRKGLSTRIEKRLRLSEEGTVISEIRSLCQKVRWFEPKAVVSVVFQARR